MPIRPENKDRYPTDWPQISKAIRARANLPDVAKEGGE
jgi:hypothetical protein